MENLLPQNKSENRIHVMTNKNIVFAVVTN